MSTSPQLVSPPLFLFFSSVFCRMFLVPRPNSPHVNFILSLENAMRQGQTSYPFVVMQFDSDAVQSVEVNLEENELQQRGLEKLLEGTHHTNTTTPPALLLLLHILLSLSVVYLSLYPSSLYLSIYLSLMYLSICNLPVYLSIYL